MMIFKDKNRNKNISENTLIKILTSILNNDLKLKGWNGLYACESYDIYVDNYYIKTIKDLKDFIEMQSKSNYMLFVEEE